MKFVMKNMGPLRYAEFEPNDLTIISGRNNTGKTYATYGAYGFLKRWNRYIQFDFLESDIDTLFRNGNIFIDDATIIENIPKIVDKLNKNYSNNLYSIFGSPAKTYEKSYFDIFLDENDILFNKEFEHKVFSGDDNLVISASRSEDKNGIDVVLIDYENTKELPRFILEDVVKQIVSNYTFSRLFPNVFILSAERTGASIFRQELDFSRNRLLSEIHNLKSTNLSSISSLLNKVDSSYALPVEDNVDYIRRLEDVAKNESYLSVEHPEIIKFFEEISEGVFSVGKNNELFYSPQSKKSLKLPMDDSSSSVRSLLALGFYLKHTARRGDMLIIDEPELNLHPDNQRKMARIIAMLVNTNLKVFITTHSDYLVKELNTLIMLNRNGDIEKEVMGTEGYSNRELLDPSRVSAYYIGEKRVEIPGNRSKTKIKTLVKSEVKKDTGIHINSFDNAIDEMNRVQDLLLWG